MAVNIPEKNNLPNEAVPWGRKVVDKVASLDRQVTALEQSAHNASRVSSAQMEVIAGQLAQISEQQTALNGQQSALQAQQSALQNQQAELNARSTVLVSMSNMVLTLSNGQGYPAAPLTQTFFIPGDPSGSRAAVIGFSCVWTGTVEYNQYKFSTLDLKIGGVSQFYESKTIDYDKGGSGSEEHRWERLQVSFNFYRVIPPEGLSGVIEFNYSRLTTSGSSTSSLINPVLTVQKGELV